MQWFSVNCVTCGRRCLIPGSVARRIADDISFVLCDDCGDEHEALTGQRPVVRITMPTIPDPAGGAGGLAPQGCDLFRTG